MLNYADNEKVEMIPMREPLRQAVLNKKAVLFDLFHTLTGLESSWTDRPSTSEVLGVSGKAWNEQLLEKSHWRLSGEEKDPTVTIEKMARAIDPSIPDERIKKAVENRLIRFEEALTKIPGVNLEVLKKIREMGKKIALISNADASEVATWPSSPLKPFFNAVVFSCDVGCVKPEKEIYEITLQRIGLKAGDCLFVGDGGSGELEGAKNVGLETVFFSGVIREMWPDRIEPRRKIADYSIDNLEELIR
jgi:putative hydrolase of the HAD superfamily